MMILTEPISRKALADIAQTIYGDMVKAVVDVGASKLAIDAELHSDLEQMLLQDGSSQEDLWGINLYPEMDGEDFIEFDSMINIRPRQGNPSRDVLDSSIREKIARVVNSYIL